ncbi:MAG TPA: phosphoadenosine phosphosulfate reductase family protein [Solirubrobacterales bacterium]|nr:phosphoadenosine phosphosulfate reductase family protein [Solirubrobacterales bacterium]
MDLAAYDVILLNSSAGKDSMASLDVIATESARQGVLDRVVVGHADLGRAEWAGTRELAREQAERYGLRFFVVAARGPDLLERVERRGMWPSPQQRWCTSDLKRGPLRRLMTQLVREHREQAGGVRVRLLNVMGMRAQESPARARKPVSRVDPGASNGRREVTDFLPLLEWSEEEVWERIGASRIADLVHPAYAAGMPRLSCRFCILAPKSALVTSARLNPDLAQEYLRVEQGTGHRFRMDCSMAEVIEAARSGEPVTPGGWSG